MRWSDLWTLYSKLKALALSSPSQWNIAAVLYRGDSLIKISSNNEKTHPKFRYTILDSETNLPVEVCKLHAETNLLPGSRPGDRIKIFRWTPGGKLKPSRPCCYCINYIKKYKIGKIEYFTTQGNWTRERISAFTR